MSDPAEDFGDFMQDLGRVTIATREQVDALEARREDRRTESTPARLSESELKDLVREQATGGPQPGQLYEHCKGGRYVVVARSLMEDTLELLVTYYAPEEGTYWTRTERNFSEMVEPLDGSNPVSRFLRVGQ